MKRAMFGSLCLVALLLCWTSLAFADNPVTFSITQLNGSLYGEYTSPYGTDHVGNVACDDIRDTVNTNTPYTYNAVSANSIIAAGSGGIWNAGAAPSQFYAAAAYIVLYDIFQKSGTQQEYGSWALWFLVDPSVALSKQNGLGSDQAGCKAIFGSSAWSGAACNFTVYSDGLIGVATAQGLIAYGNGAFSGLTVYVPKNSSGLGWCTPTDNSCQSQEFWGLPDGGSAWQYLLVVFSGIFGVIYSRRRTAMGGLA